AGPGQRGIEVIDTEEENEAVTGPRGVGIRQRRVVVVSPPVETQQGGAMLVPDLAELLVRRRILGETQQFLIPPETRCNVRDADDRPEAFHRLQPRRASGQAATIPPLRSGAAPSGP